ncbi:MAG: hypothetical protein GWN14_00820, partial [candidate division Zixibacteria bacterium]|nr:hypothetical protein [Gammaproteobacteria bacterium]NIX54503.1 hypothetical protein [candidate division Zixibacteria bacterium]
EEGKASAGTINISGFEEATLVNSDIASTSEGGLPDFSLQGGAAGSINITNMGDIFLTDSVINTEALFSTGGSI